MDLSSSLNNHECNSLETFTLNEQANYRLMEMSKSKDYFDQEIKYQQALASRLSKYLACFDHADQILTMFLSVFSGTNIFAHVREKQLLGLISSAFSLLFCLSSGIVKKLQQETKIRKKNTINYCI